MDVFKFKYFIINVKTWPNKSYFVYNICQWISIDIYKDFFLFDLTICKFQKYFIITLSKPLGMSIKFKLNIKGHHCEWLNMEKLALLFGQTEEKICAKYVGFIYIAHRHHKYRWFSTVTVKLIYINYLYVYERTRACLVVRRLSRSSMSVCV